MEARLEEVLTALRESWGPDTSQAHISSTNSPGRDVEAIGQCAVSSMIIQTYFGGDILTAYVGPYSIKHYWNQLPGGVWIDSTRGQFKLTARIRSVRLARPDEYDSQSTRDKVAILDDRMWRYIYQRRIDDRTNRLGQPPRTV